VDNFHCKLSRAALEIIRQPNRSFPFEPKQERVRHRLPSLATAIAIHDEPFSSRQLLHPKFANLRFEPPRSKPLFRGFERPSLSRIAILVVLCTIAYPALYILTLVAKDKTFVVRLIAAMWSPGVGFALGYILIRIGVQHLEAASEFMLIWYRDPLKFHSKQLGPL